jgi:hypothetical protein
VDVLLLDIRKKLRVPTSALASRLFYESHSAPDLFASLRFPPLIPKIGEVLMTSRSLKREEGWWFMLISRALGEVAEDLLRPQPPFPLAEYIGWKSEKG